MTLWRVDTPTTVETSIMKWHKTAVPAFGARHGRRRRDLKPLTIFMIPKSATANGIDGGSFLGGDATNQAYASQLANYVVSMKNTYGINLYAISIQNEPDASVNSYDACQWTNTLYP